MFDRMKRILNRKSFTLKSTELADYFQNVYSLLFTPGQPVYTDITSAKAIREGYKMAIPVYRAIRAIVQAGSGIPWVALDSKGEEIADHDFSRVWASPNPEFSGQDNMEYLIAHLVLGGNAYLRPIYVQGIPQEFWIEMPDSIQPIPSSNRNDWIEGYQYTLSNGVVIKLKKEVFLHFKQIDPGSLYVGMGAVTPSARVIDTYNEALDTQKLSMQNRGMPSGYLFPDEPLDPAQFDAFKRKFREQYLVKTGRREPWLFPRKMQWIEASQTAVEMDFTNSQWANIRQIAAAIGIDPWWVGDREHSTYNNVQEARRSLYEDVVIPILDAIEATLNLKLAPYYGDIHITYDTSNVVALRGDYGQKVEQAKGLWAMGVPFEQINARLELGFEEFPGWETGYLPFNVLPAGTAKPSEDIGKSLWAESENIDKSLWAEIANAEIVDLTKSEEYSEEYKAAEWKRIDTHRVAYWELLGKKFEALYLDMGEAAAKAVKGDIKQNVSQAIDGQRDAWLKTLSAAYFTIIEDFGKEVEETLKSQASLERKFDPFSAFVRAWVARNTAQKVTTILGTQKVAMAALIGKGLDANLSNYLIAKSIRTFYTESAKNHAMVVARTETAMASSFGQETSAKESGFTKKGWLSSRDSRVRDSHAMMDGQKVGINETFSNGCEAPGICDTAAEAVNCRCVLQFYK